LSAQHLLEIMKKIMLGTLEAWSMSLRPIDPATKRIILSDFLCPNIYTVPGSSENCHSVENHSIDSTPLLKNH
jgi:hypothetical protein